jgi:hypothetical protein
MSQPLTETELRNKAVGVLEEHLGPVEAMRFLSLLRNAPRDYQQWRSDLFKDLAPTALIDRLRNIEDDAGHSENQP